MFKLSVVTPEKTELEINVRSIVAPGSEGYLGVLSNHAPLITALMPGILSVVDESDRESYYALSGGFLMCSPYKQAGTQEKLIVSDIASIISPEIGQFKSPTAFGCLYNQFILLIFW